MLEPPEPSQEIKDWLCTLRLSQYTPYFQQRGYHVLEDCKDLTDERLLELRVFPTGHRRRILRSLEALRVTQQSGGEEDEEGGIENGRGQRKPVLHPRHIFLPDKKRGTSCQHPQSNEKSEYDLEGSQSLPPGAGLGSEFEDIPKRNVRPPLPAPRNPQNIQKSASQHTSVPASMFSSSSSSSSESISISEIPSDWEVSSEEPSLSSTDSVLHPTLSEDQGGFQCEMVENSIYEMHTSFKVAKGPRLTRSYRLRHRPVPEIPNQTMPPLQDRSATPAQTTSPEHLTGFEGPTGANGIQKVDPCVPFDKTPVAASSGPHNPQERVVSFFTVTGSGPRRVASGLQTNSVWPASLLSSSSLLPPTTDRGPSPLQRTLTPIAPYGETFLYNRPESVPDQGGKEVLQKGFKDKIKQKKQRRKILKQRDSKEKESPPAPTIPDSYKDEYSTVVECASILPQASFDQGFAVTPNALAVGAAASGSVSQGGSLIMVECDLYSEPADALRGASINALPDISPYACFYGAPKHKVLKVGWLDKLSPQGKCVFQRRWVRFDGKSLAYYNNDK
eukprot:superscaffoldBa00006866_g21969